MLKLKALVILNQLYFCVVESFKNLLETHPAVMISFLRSALAKQWKVAYYVLRDFFGNSLHFRILVQVLIKSYYLFFMLIILCDNGALTVSIAIS